MAKPKTEPKKEKGIDHKVSVVATLFPEDTMFFRVKGATAERDGKTWECDTNVAGGNPIIQLPDGRWVVFGWPELIEAANEAGAKA